MKRLATLFVLLAVTATMSAAWAATLTGTSSTTGQTGNGSQNVTQDLGAGWNDGGLACQTIGNTLRIIPAPPPPPFAPQYAEIAFQVPSESATFNTLSLTVSYNTVTFEYTSTLSVDGDPAEDVSEGVVEFEESEEAPGDVILRTGARGHKIAAIPTLAGWNLIMTAVGVVGIGLFFIWRRG